MHLLAGDIGRIDDGDAAVDLRQSPGDIVVLSSADSELAALAAAVTRRPPGAPTVRLANPMRLGHPLSVDLYVEKTISSAKLVIVRQMGGVGYWPYGLERLRALARGGGPALAVVPGEDRWDEGLEAYSTVDPEAARRLWRYFVEGGPDNIARALAFSASLIEAAEAPEAPAALPQAGFYRPGVGPFNALPAGEGTRAVAFVVFYRSILLAAQTAPIDALAEALRAEGLDPVPLFVASLKDRASRDFLDRAFDDRPPAIVLNTTAFAASRFGAEGDDAVLDRAGRPVLQVVLAGSSEEAWRESRRGLLARDLTMNVVLPEVDGRILTRAISFKAEAHDAATDSRIATYRPVADRVRFVAAQAAAWVRLARRAPEERRIAIVLSNYPSSDGRLANAVGLDAPESAIRLAAAMGEAGYALSGFPGSAGELMARLIASAAHPSAKQSPEGGGAPLTARPRASGDPDLEGRGGTERAWSDLHAEFHQKLDPRLRGDERRWGRLSLAGYHAFLATIPASLRAALAARWGTPEADPSFRDGAFRFRLVRYGNVAVGIQPARGDALDPKGTYHDADLVPPHAYLAFYAWLRTGFAADAILHLGKHGTLEWLPGKALGLSAECWPEAILGPTPLVYPFIVNDPGEGSQAKRRSSAVIVDHLMPPVARAGTYGPLAELETLIDEYYVAAGVDPRRRAWLEGEILAAAERHGLDRDLGIGRGDRDGALRALDAHLCELKELQIRDGLHVLGTSPEAAERAETLVAMARVRRPGGRPADESLQRAIAGDLGLGFDPLDCDPAAPWSGPRPDLLAGLSDAPWRSAGDTVERIEALAAALVAGGTPGDMSRTAAVLGWVRDELAPRLDRSGRDELGATLAALDGRFVRPGPSGAPTRGRPDVLPTGRNFYSVDVRAVPTPAAWTLGRAAAEALALRYFQDEGDWPRAIAMSAWGTANMRTGGDDIAEALALIGAAPVWEPGSGRVTGFRVLPLGELGRPRIDVTLRISGLFRDAFPAQIDLFDSAARAIADLDEPDDANPLAAARRQDGGIAPRIFGVRPGGYGTGLNTPIETGAWATRADLATLFLDWGSHAYGGGRDGEAAEAVLAERLRATDAVVQNQDNREHDILDSDTYYQFEGGLAAAVEALKGHAPRLYHGDHSRPEKPVVRPLQEEIGRVVRGRAANPKWIAGAMRHGYRGGAEMAATVDFLFAFAATTDAVGDHHFDGLFDAYLGDDAVRAFLADHNPVALADIARRLREAIDRGLWSPRSNSAHDRLSALITERKEAAE